MPAAAPSTTCTPRRRERGRGQGEGGPRRCVNPNPSEHLYCLFDSNMRAKRAPKGHQKNSPSASTAPPLPSSRRPPLRPQRPRAPLSIRCPFAALLLPSTADRSATKAPQKRHSKSTLRAPSTAPRLCHPLPAWTPSPSTTGRMRRAPSTAPTSTGASSTPSPCAPQLRRLDARAPLHARPLASPRPQLHRTHPRQGRGHSATPSTTSTAAFSLACLLCAAQGGQPRR